MTHFNQVLLDKWKNEELGHFYILKSPEKLSVNPLPLFNDWSREFLTPILREDFKQHKTTEQILHIINNGHPDILFINPESEQKKYTQENFLNFFSFLNLKNFELSHRFIFITHPHLISESLSNKLLKSLEEPPIKTTIFFFQTIQSPLLPTISGRAIKIKLPIPRTYKENISSQSFKRSDNSHEYLLELAKEESLDNKLIILLTEYLKTKQKLSELIKFLQANPKTQNTFIRLIIKWQSNLLTNFDQKHLFLDQVKWFAKSVSYNNYSTERLYALLEILHPFES